MEAQKQLRWHLFSDMDGTLLSTRDGSLPQANIDAVGRFMAAGGRFSVATGRSVAAAAEVASRVGTNAPSILLDGALLYDFSRGAVIEAIPLPADIPAMAEEAAACFPKAGITVQTLDGGFEAGAPSAYASPHHRDARGKLRTIAGRWLRMVFSSPDAEHSDALADWLRQRGGGAFSVVASSAVFVGVSPNGCSKGAAIRRLCAMGLCDPEWVAAIGDYDNDADMLGAAKRSACPLGASDKALAQAGQVLCSAADGAVAQFIGLLTE